MDFHEPPGPRVDRGYGRGAARRGRAALWIAGLGLIVLTCAAFVLSYDGLYATALAGGVRPSLAFLYPTIFDGFLVVAFAAALVLRSAGLRATWYPWTLIVALLLAAAGANILHALGRESLLPPDSMKVIVASVPPVALGLAFPLWLLMFVHLRGGRATSHPAGIDAGSDTAARRRTRERDAGTGDILPGLRHEDGGKAAGAQPSAAGDRAGRTDVGPPPAATQPKNVRRLENSDSDDHADGAAGDKGEPVGAEQAREPADEARAGAADRDPEGDERDAEASVPYQPRTRDRATPSSSTPSGTAPSATPPSGTVRSSPTPPTGDADR